MQKNTTPRQIFPISACLLLTSLTGCHFQAQDGSPAFPIVQVSSANQSQVQQAAQRYLADLQARDYPKAEALMTKEFQSKTPPSQIASLLQGPDHPFVGAKNFQFEPAQPLANTSQIVLRALFVGGDDKPYRTNFLLTQSGNGWLINGLIPPATHHKGVIKRMHST